MDTILPRTFPYRPSGGFTPEEIFGGAAVALEADGSPITGSTKETRDRLKMVGIRTVEALTDVFLSRIRPTQGVETRPGEGYIGGGYIGETPGYVYDPQTGAYVPKIRIQGAATPGPKLSGTALFIALGLGGLLLMGILKEGRAE